ncbi:hypothetical protein D3C85_939200 [compost metagenome]
MLVLRIIEVHIGYIFKRSIFTAATGNNGIPNFIYTLVVTARFNIERFSSCINTSSWNISHLTLYRIGNLSNRNTQQSQFLQIQINLYQLVGQANYFYIF